MRRVTHILRGLILVWLGVLPGCLVLQVGVSNPAPNLSRIGIAPFVNLSSERSVDGRRFAEAYYTELQKVPGFQVIPVGVVETAMHDHKLNLDSPRDLQKLTEILDIDGLCFGAVTEYNPYYPPRLGLQISWYTNSTPDFYPGIPIAPDARKAHSSMWRALKRGYNQGAGSAGPPCDPATTSNSQPSPPGETPGFPQTWTDQLRRSLPGFPCSQRDHFSQETVAGDNLIVLRAQSPTSTASGNVPQKSSNSELTAWELALLQAMQLDESAADETSAKPISPNSSQNVSPAANAPLPHSEPHLESSSEPHNLARAIPASAQTNSQRTSAPANTTLQSPTESPLQSAATPVTPVQLGMGVLPACPPQPASPFPLAGQPMPYTFSPNPALNWDATQESSLPQPYMSYTRVFDGADAGFTASLKNYLELSGDQRSGGWTGHLHRSEDFIRFCMHRMIQEMLILHGGESKRRFVLTSRKYQ